MQRKVFFVRVGGTKSPESGKILDISALDDPTFVGCGFVSSNSFFFDQNIVQFMFKKKNIYRFHTFQGEGSRPKV